MAKTTLTQTTVNSLQTTARNARKWIVENKTEFILLTTILAIGAFLRLYRISEYMTFLGDEGRDVIIVRRFLVDFDLILVGPGTSIGNMYLGPLYYYMMAPFLFLFNFSPVGPAAMIALLGVATIFFVWFVVRRWFPSARFARSGQAPLSMQKVNIGALIAAFLYAISPTIITYSRSSWNPNIMPFFALLTVYSVWKFWFDKQYKWLIVTGISTASILQSHYLGLLLIPTVGLFWLLVFVREFRGTKGKKFENWNLKIGNLARNSMLGLGIFALLMSPLVIFDARHGWRNFEAMKVFFTERQTTVSARPWNALPNVLPIREEFFDRVLTGYNESFAMFISYFTLIFMAIILGKILLRGNLYKKLVNAKLSKSDSGFLTLAVWAITAMVGLGLYKQQIYDHYYGFIFAAPFILIGGIVETFRKHAKPGFFALLIVLFLVALQDIKENPLNFPPNRQLQRAEEVGEKIIEEAKGEKFNLAVIAERNYEGAYQYHLERKSAPIVMIDAQRIDETVTDQLYVVCELADPDECDPTHNPKTEVANFGWTVVENELQVSGITLYKLIHSK